MIDAGSTGTRVHVFRHSQDAASRFPSVDLPDLQLRIQPGLSTYGPDGKGAGDSLLPLLEFAREHVRGRNLYASAARDVFFWALDKKHQRDMRMGHACWLGGPQRPPTAPLRAHTQVPHNHRGDTPVHLMATAGLRLLPPNQSEAVLASCRRELGRSGFWWGPG